jgi:hypothetical protein
MKNNFFPAELGAKVYVGDRWMAVKEFIERYDPSSIAGAGKVSLPGFAPPPAAVDRGDPEVVDMGSCNSAPDIGAVETGC